MAAAFAALVSLYESLPLIWYHPRHSFSFEEKQLRSLFENVFYLIEFMNYSNNSHGATKEAAEALESRIARAVQAAEDVIESHVVDQIHSGSTLGGNRRFRFLFDLQKAIQDVEFICMKTLNIQKSISGFKAEHPITSSTSLAAENNRMVGFDDKLHQLLDLLTGVPSSRRVIPIVGMGGIGKTTLATNAFQHKLIVEHFYVRLWAKVSQEFSVHKILTQLLASLHSQIKEKTCFLSKTSSGACSVDELGEKLYKNLCGQKYLIILDDMWGVQGWDEIKFFFPDTSNGSRIVVTTRQSDVACHFGSQHLDVPLLDMDSSWDLFCEKTFEDHGCPSELEDIGKKIVEKCRGLPLAIVVVGGHFRKSSRMIEYWENIANDMSSVLNSGENEHCLNILSLSYRHLPVYLKPCFLFLGVFGEDEEILVSELLNLWIGEGFIERYENYSYEQVAYSYLANLVQRNLLSVHGLNVDRRHEFCRVHDLLREMCLKIAKNDEFFSVLDTRGSINEERRVVIKGQIPKANHRANLFIAPRSTSHIRSLICEGGQISFDMKLLRVLNKVDSNKINSQQVNLRFLKADFYSGYLPSPISLLWNLQTLIINGVSGPIIAPYEIWEMLQLRHIEVVPIHLPHPLDEGNVLVLENLHTLCNVTNIMLSEEVCRRIPNIEKLEVTYCDEPSSDFCLYNLSCFQKLKSLECDFHSDPKWHAIALNLTFPSSLERLELLGCRLSWKEVTMKVGFLPHLEILDLSEDAVTGSEWSLGEGETLFPRLRKLHITHHDLIQWNAEEFHFPVLEHLALLAPKLDEFPSGIGEITTLRAIFMMDCSLSSTISAMRMVVEQIEQGNEDLQLHVTFCDDEEALEKCKQMVQEEGLTSNNIHLTYNMKEK